MFRYILNITYSCTLGPLPLFHMIFYVTFNILAPKVSVEMFKYWGATKEVNNEEMLKIGFKSSFDFGIEPLPVEIVSVNKENQL